MSLLRSLDIELFCYSLDINNNNVLYTQTGYLKDKLIAESQKELFKNNNRMKMQFSLLERMDKSKLQSHKEIAAKFLKALN